MDEAIEQYREAIRLKPGYVEARHNLGNALAAAGRSDEAAEAFRAAVACQPTFTESHYGLGQILDRLVNYCFPILDRIEDNIDKVEDLIFTRTVPETVREISMIRRDLISFRRIIHPQMSVLEELEREKYPFFKEDQDVYFGDIADHIRKIWDGLEDCKEVVDGLADTSNWLTSHRIQEVMRFLTIVMALIAPPTLIASIYGMNIHLPGGVTSGDYFSFIFVIVSMLITAGGMLYYFHRKKWI
jgi:magnesium transporter